MALWLQGVPPLLIIRGLYGPKSSNESARETGEKRPSVQPKPTVKVKQRHFPSQLRLASDTEGVAQKQVGGGAEEVVFWTLNRLNLM